MILVIINNSYFRSSARAFKLTEDAQISDEKELLNNLTAYLLGTGNMSQSLSDSFYHSLRTSTRSSIASYSEIKGDSYKGSLISTEELDLNRVFSIPVLRRYFLEKITWEAKLNRDHPISVDKWPKLKFVSSILASSKLVFNTFLKEF